MSEQAHLDVLERLLSNFARHATPHQDQQLTRVDDSIARRDQRRCDRGKADVGSYRTQEAGRSGRLAAGRTVDPSKNEFAGLEACAPGGGQDKLAIHCEVNNPNVSISAWLIGHMFTAPLAQWANKSIKLDPMMRAAAGDLAAKGVTYDQDYVQVNFARRETWGYLQVFYYFDPSTESIASSNAMSYGDTDWAADRIKHFPEKQGYVERIEGWASKQWPDFKRAFDEAEKG